MIAHVKPRGALDGFLGADVKSAPEGVLLGLGLGVLQKFYIAL